MTDGIRGFPNDEEELIDVLSAISIVSLRLAKKLRNVGRAKSSRFFRHCSEGRDRTGSREAPRGGKRHQGYAE